MSFFCTEFILSLSETGSLYYNKAEVITMAFLQVQFYSKALNVCSTVNVILPEPDQGIGVDASKVGKLPKVLYLLHGYSDDHSIWMRRTSVERYAAQHNLAVIMPAVNHSFYNNEVHGERYWDYISDELPKAMHRFFRLSDKPEDTFAAGLSMGGYGAWKCGLGAPETFGAAASLSGALDVVSLLKNRAQDQNTALFRGIFGSVEETEGSDNDLLALMDKGAGAPDQPRLYAWCGTEDFLYQDNLTAWEKARRLGYDLTCRQSAGDHQWKYWDQWIQEVLRWWLDIDLDLQ